MTKSIAGQLHKYFPEKELELAKTSYIQLADEDVALENLRAHMHGRPDRVCQPGTYVRLHTKEKNWVLMMSDVPYELISGRVFQRLARGQVLVAGLGLGATTIEVVRKPEVERVTVVEKNPDVIAIVEPALRKLLGKNAKKLFIIQDDAFTWKSKGAKYNTIWIDIWPEICGDNLPDITRLKRRYGHLLDRSDERCWMGVWEEYTVRRQVKSFLFG